MSSGRTKTKFGDLVSITKFASLKNVPRQNVHNWIRSGRIILTEVGDKKMVDLDVYREFDPKEIPQGAP